MKKFLFCFALFAFLPSAHAGKSSPPTFNGDDAARYIGNLNAKPKSIMPYDQVKIKRGNNHSYHYNGDYKDTAVPARKTKKQKRANSFSGDPRKPKSATGNYQE